MQRIAISFHTSTNVGFAIEPLERLFFAVGRDLAGPGGTVVLSYNGLASGRPRWLADDSVQVLHCTYASGSRPENRAFLAAVESQRIDTVLAFDLPVGSPILRELRLGVAPRVVSYWGAPMSSLNHGLTRLLKRLEVAWLRDCPDHFVFESEGMRDTAVLGRGVPASRTTVVPLGYDRLPGVEPYPREQLASEIGIEPGRRILFYAGHMEERKGVHVLVEAMKHLVDGQGRRDVHLLICGNKNGDEAPHRARLGGSAAASHVTFAGYRNDIPRLMRSSYLGCIASTGWDSFPRTSLEMQAYGLPVLVSELPGIRETVAHGTTGYTFACGDPAALAERVALLLDDPVLRDGMSVAAARRIAQEFTIERQRRRLQACLAGPS